MHPTHRRSFARFVESNGCTQATFQLKKILNRGGSDTVTGMPEVAEGKGCNWLTRGHTP